MQSNLQISSLINIEEFGLITPKKKKMSKMFVQAVIDLVDASYSCAIEGKTIELMLKQFSVMQQEPLSNEGYSPQSNTQRQRPSVMQRIFGWKDVKKKRDNLNIWNFIN